MRLIALSAALLTLSCAPKIETSVLVTVTWGEMSPSMYVLEFIGPSAGQNTRRPTSVQVDPLTSPQTARILVPSAEIGQTLAVTVKGLDKDLNAVAAGSAVSAIIASNAETPMAVSLSPIVVGPVDAGVCAGPVELRTVEGLTAIGCRGASGDCTVCGISADRCVAGQCRCGAGAACAEGLMCIHKSNGDASCVCGPGSNCLGCCQSNECVPFATQSRAACGAAGQSCSTCSGITACSNGACLNTIGGCITNNRCSSGSSCDDPKYPNCIAASANNNRCEGCDLLRTNKCGTTGACSCGTLDQPCEADKYCVPTLSGAECRSRLAP